ncbi:MAG: NADH-quinone oxidoreductase subunit N [Gemmataceae bacterium]
MLPQLDTWGSLTSLIHFLPEVLICLGIVSLLLVRLLPGLHRTHLGGLALWTASIALAASLFSWSGPIGTGQGVIYLFGDLTQGMLLYDRFALYLRILLYLLLLLTILLTRLTGVPDREDSADFYVLLLGATLGMVLMGMSLHLLMVFIAIEMASLPSYALAGFTKTRRLSSEAALKYVVYGSGSAGVMLYGISLIAGRFGTGYLPDVAAGYVLAFQEATRQGFVDPVLLFGSLCIFGGIAFKLALVPFHFWCPDVFEGASAEVAGFLSVGSKVAALFLLARMLLMIGGYDPIVRGGELLNDVPWIALDRSLIPCLVIVAALTTTFGNFAAYPQTNLKRLLAYSTIAHAGYMLMSLCTLSRVGVEVLVFYSVGYLFMNLGAFAVVAVLRQQTGSEELLDYRGVARRSPTMVVSLCFFLLSLLGIPPLIGFIAKFRVFAVLWEESQRYSQIGESGIGQALFILLVIGALNTILSAYYYLKIMKVMVLDRRTEDIEGTEPPRYPTPWLTQAYTIFFAFAVLGLGIGWGPLLLASQQALARFAPVAGQFRSEPQPDGGGPLRGAFAPPGKPPQGGVAPDLGNDP